MTGKSFEYILSNYNNEKLNLKMKKRIFDPLQDSSMIFHKLTKVLVEKGIIFARMQPNDKVNLVKLLKENKNNIVAMCGDGANDCGALISADIGISISSKKGANIISHFDTTDDSISCIETILRNGRACYENSLITLKFMIIYGSIEGCSSILLRLENYNDLTNNQFYFIDIFVVLLTFIISSR